ncbi:hypothetical protein BKA65DRAFT_117858 [Rhexocercosporidium sp. MPI-PUGE-AT-0058]|nr:hypothetical protein BKA65DRAFT_117858 [Rhexocercosporidium sp. MPI-PUGE-AT-0058]
MASFDEEQKFEILASKPWNTTELILAEALNVGPVKPSNLKATSKFQLHTFFARDSWQSVSDEDYKLLLPSMQLASNLIQVGTPYLCSFVPSRRVHDYLADVRPSLTMFQVDPEEWTAEDMEETREELLDIADYVEWELNDTMAKDNKWLGITRLVTDDKWGPRPWRDLQREDILRSDNELMGQGAFRRNLKVGIMKEYVTALKKYSKTSEEHLRATFLAAITMTHEIAHVVWHQDFRSMNYEINGVEPFIGNCSISELGCSFIASIFDGKNPYECGKQVPTDFTRALYWERIPTLETNELYRKDFSMSIHYIQRVLSQESWDKLDPTRPDFVIDARAMLQPEEDTVHASNLQGGASLSAKEPPATAHTREWTVIDIYTAPKLIWKMEYNERRARNDDKFELVTQAEKDLAIYEISQTLPPITTNYLRFNHWGHDGDYTRPIDDGVVALDLVGLGQAIDLSALKRIEIKYRPKPGDFAEQGDHHPRLQIHQARASARPGVSIPRLDWFSTLDADSLLYDKDVPKDFQFGGPREYYEPADVLALIANKQPEIIARTTIKDAHQFCTERNICFGRHFPATYAEQNQKLDRTKDEDRALIERMRQFCLETAKKLFAGNNQAILYIYFAEFKYIDDWSLEDLKARCIFDGLDHTGTLAVIRRRLRDHMVKIFQLFAQDHNMSHKKEVFKKVGLVDEVNLVAWTDTDFIYFFRINNLPAWGNRRIWFERYAAFVREQKHGLARRSDINHDSKGEIQRSVNLVETYAWDVVLAGSSVQALKGSLFEAGMFPADSTLNLYCGNDRQTSLEDDKPLSFYEHACWKSLSLETTRTSQEEKPDIEIADVEPPILVYKPRIPDGIDIGSSLTVDPEHWGVNGRDLRVSNTSDPSSSFTDSNDAPKKAAIPKDVQRIYDLAHNKARPTITEHLDSIYTHVEELTRILHPLGARDTLRPHLKTIRSTSVVEMLDSFEDMKEVREERQRFIDLQVDPEEVFEREREKKVELLRELRPDLVVEGNGKMVKRPVELGKRKRKVGGFMGDIYKALKVREGVL